jgi:hypothetical protein
MLLRPLIPGLGSVRVIPPYYILRLYFPSSDEGSLRMRTLRFFCGLCGEISAKSLVLAGTPRNNSW